MHPDHWKGFVSGLGIFMLALTASSGIALAQPVASILPRSAVAAGLTAFTQLNLYPNIETIGVVASGTLPATAELLVRQSGEAAWHSGHPLMRIDDGRLVGSLFGLAPSTSYDIKVVDGAAEIGGSITTQPDELQFAPSATLYVNAGAAAGGNGSVAAPLRTIQEAVNHAGPGTQVLVADGVYHEAVSFPASGTAGNWIQVKAQGSAAVLDGSQNRTGSIWTPDPAVNHVYSTKIGGAIAYLARDGQRFYAYDDKSGLNKALGHNGVPMNEGWYFEPSTLKLFVRSLDNPATHSWQIPYLNHAFDIGGRDWIWIEGFEVRFYGTRTDGCGVCTLNASHVVVRGNRIHNLQLGVFINWNGTENQGNDARIEYNEISDPPVDTWPWKAVKGSSMEGTAVVVRGHVGAIVRGNELHNFFNGIYTGSSGALENSALAFDADIYGNYIHHIGDDALEPEGASINQRFRDNIVDRVFVGMSLAPVTQGPTWVLRSLFTNYTGRGFKWDGNSDGIVLIYHNTAWSNATAIDAMDMISAVHNAVLRNNIFQSNGYGVYEVATGSTGHDWDNDNWYVTRASPHFRWENIPYGTLAGLCAGAGLECNAYEDSPGLVDPSGGVFTLLSSSPNIDRGVIIDGINDDYAGAAPDIGAFEYLRDVTISGNAGMEGVILHYTDGTPKMAISQLDGSYSLEVSSHWSGLVTPEYPGYSFEPASRSYSRITADQTGQDFAPFENNTAIYVGAQLAEDYYVPSGGRVTPRYGVAGGPVHVLTLDASNILTSQRVHNSNGFVNEMMGFPNNQLTNEYWFPWYDNLGMQSSILVGNPSTTDTAHVTITIAGTDHGPYDVGPGEVIAETYTVMDGPVHITSNINVVASERVATGQGFVQETMGYPNNQLAQEYWFPWYDNLGMMSWILVGNPSATDTAHVTINIAGTDYGPYDVGPGGRITPQFGVMNGPVHITSDIDVFTSERVHNGNGFVQETMGYPNNRLTKEYWFPWYDNLGMTSWILVGNPSTTDTAHVTITIAGTDYGPYEIGPGDRITPQFGVMNGPVHITSDINVFASERVHTGQGFVQETMGYPNDRLTTEYWFPWYDNITTANWVLIGRP